LLPAGVMARGMRKCVCVSEDVSCAEHGRQ
jgi:hypothetical protein